MLSDMSPSVFSVLKCTYEVNYYKLKRQKILLNIHDNLYFNT